MNIDQRHPEGPFGLGNPGPLLIPSVLPPYDEGGLKLLKQLFRNGIRLNANAAMTISRFFQQNFDLGTSPSSLPHYLLVSVFPRAVAGILDACCALSQKHQKYDGAAVSSLLESLIEAVRKCPHINVTDSELADLVFALPAPAGAPKRARGAYPKLPSRHDSIAWKIIDAVEQKNGTAVEAEEWDRRRTRSTRLPRRPQNVSDRPQPPRAGAVPFGGITLLHGK